MLSGNLQVARSTLAEEGKKMVKFLMYWPFLFFLIVFPLSVCYYFSIIFSRQRKQIKWLRSREYDSLDDGKRRKLIISCNSFIANVALFMVIIFLAFAAIMSAKLLNFF